MNLTNVLDVQNLDKINSANTRFLIKIIRREYKSGKINTTKRL